MTVIRASSASATPLKSTANVTSNARETITAVGALSGWTDRSLAGRFFKQVVRLSSAAICWRLHSENCWL